MKKLTYHPYCIQGWFFISFWLVMGIIAFRVIHTEAFPNKTSLFFLGLWLGSCFGCIFGYHRVRTKITMDCDEMTVYEKHTTHHFRWDQLTYHYRSVGNKHKVYYICADRALNKGEIYDCREKSARHLRVMQTSTIVIPIEPMLKNAEQVEAFIKNLPTNPS